MTLPSYEPPENVSPVYFAAYLDIKSRSIFLSFFFFFFTAMLWCLEIAILLQSSNTALKYVVSWETFTEIPGLSLLLECKTLFVILSHKFGNNVHAGLFVSGFFDSGPRIEEPDFYSWWQEEKVWAPASANQVG